MIAISYRREDSLAIAGRLYDRLHARFGRENVFMDFDSIPPGVDFREQIKKTIERSNLVIAMIGTHWLGEQSDGSRRIDDPTDFVRLEIEYALKSGVPIIPLLINNTQMPKSEKLPLSIEAIAFRNALPLDTGMDFHHHADRLITGICNSVDVSREKDHSLPDSGGNRSTTSAKLAHRSEVDLSPRPSRYLLWCAIIVFAIIATGMIYFLPGKYVRQSVVAMDTTVERDAAVDAAKKASAPQGSNISHSTVSNTPLVRASRLPATSPQESPPEQNSSVKAKNVFSFLSKPNTEQSPYRYLTRSVRMEIDNAQTTPPRWQSIIVRSSGTRQGDATTLNYYNRDDHRGQDGPAYHFVIGNGTSSGNGQIEVGDSWRQQIVQAERHTDFHTNLSLSICLVGDFDQDQPTRAQLESCEELIRYLRQRFSKLGDHLAVLGTQSEINLGTSATSSLGDKFLYAWLRRFQDNP